MHPASCDYRRIPRTESHAPTCGQPNCGPTGGPPQHYLDPGPSCGRPQENCTNALATEPMPGVAVQLDRLDALLGELTDQLENLTHRLAGVLIPPEPADPKAPTATGMFHTPCPVADRVIAANDRIVSRIHDLSDLRHRLDV